MARITAGVGCSHVPRLAWRWTRGLPSSPTGSRFSKALRSRANGLPRKKPDVIFLVYNDHCTAFDASCIPTFALGCAAEFQPADEGWGPRPVPVVKNHQKLASHIAQSLILDEFDMTIMNEMEVDHGLTVPLSVMYGELAPRGRMARFGDPSGGECGAISSADRQPLLSVGQSGAPRDREL